jgi:hypothetical protein
MPPEPHGAAQPGRQAGEAPPGEPAGRGLTGPGPPPVTLGHVLTAKEAERAREAARPAGGQSAGRVNGGYRRGVIGVPCRRDILVR